MPNGDIAVAIDKAWKAGMNAFNKGLKLTDNPFESGMYRDLWAEGYKHAQATVRTVLNKE